MFDFSSKSLILATSSYACGERLITALMLHSSSIYFYLNRQRDRSRSWKPLRVVQGYRNGTPSIMAWFAFIPSVYMPVFRFRITWWNTQVSGICMQLRVVFGLFFFFAVLNYKSALFQRDWRLSHRWCWIISCRKIDRILIRLRWLFSSYLSILHFILKLWIVSALGKHFNSKY